MKLYGYVDHTSQLQNPYLQQWDYSGAVQSRPGPMNTVRATRTPQIARAPTRPNIVPPQRVVQHMQFQPSLEHLMIPESRPYSAARIVDPIVDPITRLYGNDAPWNLYQMRYSDVNDSQNAVQYTQKDISQYRQRPCSDIDNVSDSGYHTQPPRSVLSNEPGHGGQELSPDLMIQASRMNVNGAPNASQTMVRTTSDQLSVSQHSSRSGGRQKKYYCPELNCNTESKCASDHKRHMLRHEKSFICTEFECKRAGKGFSTINDLDRHKKSVHKIGVEKSKSYQCAATGCTHRTKIWPRLDNFKQHLERMHRKENILELIKSSEYQPQEPASIQQPFSVDPALLAGMGDPNDSLSPMGGQAFSYHSSVSFPTGSFSSSSQISPIVASVDTSFSQRKVPSSTLGNSTSPADNRRLTSSDHTSTASQKRRRLSKSPPTKTTSASQVMPCSTDNQITGLVPTLSNGPQTKVEQQRQVLDKLKANINIEDILTHVLGTQQQQDNSQRNASSILSADERALASQAIADLLAEGRKSRRSQQRRSTLGSNSSLQSCGVNGCKFSGRPCDLKKHMKRHQRPYGCTYPKCHKRFGAKSDWKRHENSQHFQLEAFRCDVLVNAGKKCGNHSHRSKQFQEHLAKEHNVTSDSQLETSMKRCRIGKNCQGQYWCGFCCEIMILKSKRNEAWDERFNHIAHHFEQEKRSIDDWLCVEQDKTKKLLREEEATRYAFTDEADAGADTGTNDSDNELSPNPEDWSLVSAETYQTPAQHGSNDRNAPAAERTPTILWNCCQCQGGPVTHSVQPSCPECPHRFCDSCSRFYADDSELDYTRH
ncbi:hypothetical protein C7974DRAFT_155937 [Boeremia exigua]|uniref:uncharacterized protein n=1 Tax=Boeremia exigua TaxID=749465 RepID=UPI001E8D772E|nr:uncharacterized protein C7974DRAFT_155937 [Boeremia exigua]KAH6638189.1 hypothetical protein C7974DRAFT_155937 [Boeremia exigua]